MSTQAARNADIADVLDRTAELLAMKEANPFRVRSYRRAADAVRNAKGSIVDGVRSHGIGRLTAIPGIGDRLASCVPSPRGASIQTARRGCR